MGVGTECQKTECQRDWVPKKTSAKETECQLVQSANEDTFTMWVPNIFIIYNSQNYPKPGSRVELKVRCGQTWWKSPNPTPCRSLFGHAIHPPIVSGLTLWLNTSLKGKNCIVETFYWVISEIFFFGSRSFSALSILGTQFFCTWFFGTGSLWHSVFWYSVATSSKCSCFTRFPVISMISCEPGFLDPS